MANSFIVEAWSSFYHLSTAVQCANVHISRAFVFWFGTLSPVLRSFLLYFMSFSYHFNTLVVVLVCPCRVRNCWTKQWIPQQTGKQKNKKQKTNRNGLGTNECEHSSSSSLSHRQMYSVTLYYISGESSKWTELTPGFCWTCILYSMVVLMDLAQKKAEIIFFCSKETEITSRSSDDDENSRIAKYDLIQIRREFRQQIMPNQTCIFY